MGGFRKGSMRWLLLALVMALLAAACGGDDESATGGTDGDQPAGEDSGEDGGEPSGRLIVGMSADPTSLDYQAASDPGTEFATWSINEGLVEFDGDGNVVPLLASEAPEMSEDDPTRWRVTLREGIEFSNGEPLDAAAVKANVDRVVDPDFASPLMSNITTLEGAEVVDDLTVDIITTDPDPDFDYRLSALRLVAPKAAAEEGYADHPVGTGPFTFKSWARGESISLEANPNYWGEGPGVAEVEIRTIPDLSTRIAALNSGEIHIAASLTADQAESVPGIIQSTAPVEADASRIAIFKEPFNDPRFRQALNYALDKETMAEELYGEFAEVANCTIVAPISGAYTDGLEAYPYDPDKARELIDEVGLPDGFTLEFNGSTGLWAGSRELNEAMASYWREVGLDVDLKINEPAVQLDLLNHGGQGSTGGNPDTPGLAYTSAAASTMHASRQVGLYIDRDGYAAAIGREYPELDPLVKTAFSALDDEERQAAYDELAEIACDEAFFIFGLVRYDIWGASDDVQYEPVAGPVRRFNLGRVTLG